MISYLGLGSNLGVPKRQLKKAVNALRHLPRTSLLRYSNLYSSYPVGPRDQPIYYNMVVVINTTLRPQTLLSYCQAIENQHQRVRKKRWGSRTIDIDLLLYGNTIIHSHRLSIPHPQLLKRDFVLMPLLEIAPLICLPNGDPIKPYLSQCKKNIIPNHH